MTRWPSMTIFLLGTFLLFYGYNTDRTHHVVCIPLHISMQTVPDITRGHHQALHI